MVKMKFKDFEFPSNPLFIKTEMANKINKRSVLSGESKAFYISGNSAVIKADGCFWGKDGADASLRLKAMMESRKAGWLFLPDGSCFNAYMFLLDIKEDAKKSCISHSISFVEKSHCRNDEYNFGFTYADDNENMFDIAFRCDISIEKLMELNDFSNPFSVKKGDRVVLQ